MDRNIARAPFEFIAGQYTIQFTLSDILQKHGLAQCHCSNMSILFLTLSLFLSLLLPSFGPKLLLGKYVAMLSRRARPAKIRAPLSDHRALAVCSVLLSNKVTPRCNPEFVGLLSGKFTSVASKMLFKKVPHFTCHFSFTR